MSNALSLEFPSAIHLRCFLHFKDNIKSKLVGDLKLTQTVANEFIVDIFGKASTLQFGLVDAENEQEFCSKLASLEEIWNKRESDLTGKESKFFQWFSTHRSDVVKKHMLRPLRTASGLGSPPLPFYTNSVESINKVLKHHANYQKHQLPEFIEILQQLYYAQEQEIEKALSGTGEYRVLPSLKEHHYESRKWFAMSSKKRKAALSRFMSASGTTTTTTSINTQSIINDTDNPLCTFVHCQSNLV